MNVLNATGNIGKDAEVRFLPNSTPVAQFSFALTSGYGEKKVTTWLRCSLFGKRAETLSPMLTKGTLIAITGELTNKPYQDKAGAEKHSLEVRLNDVTLLGRKEASQVNNDVTAINESKSTNASFDNFDDDIPF